MRVICLLVISCISCRLMFILIVLVLRMGCFILSLLIMLLLIIDMMCLLFYYYAHLCF